MVSLMIMDCLQEKLIGCEDEGEALSIVNQFIKRISGADPKIFMAKNLDNEEYMKVALKGGDDDDDGDDDVTGNKMVGWVGWLGGWWVKVGLGEWVRGGWMGGE